MIAEKPDSDLEERKFALDSEVRLRELALKEAELKRGGLSAAQATVAGATLALISGLIGALITAWSSHNIESGKSLNSLQIEELKVKGNLDLERSKQIATEALERKKFETSLILEAIKTSARSDAIRNLKFFVKAGFVSDPDGKILNLNDESLPSITTPSAESAGRALRATGRLVAQQDFGPVLCTAVAVSPRQVVTASFCVTNTKKSTPVREIKFQIGRRAYPLRVVARQEQSKLALLEIDSSERLEVYLDRTHLRDPLSGERVYLAIAAPDQESVQIQTCTVTKSLPAESDFEYDCAAGGGSAGAVIIAVVDDALLGIHHSGRKTDNGEVGVGAKISKALATLSAGLPN